MSTGKRTEEDVPTRVYRSTLDRINAHLTNSKHHKEHKTRKGKKTIKKTTINEFIVMCLDAYEMVKEAEVLYANELYKDLAEARGEAVIKATRAKEQVKLPMKVVIVGKDEL